MTKNTQPNIIFLFPDQWRGDCLGHLGHPDVYTPWADQLAKEGQSYTRCFSPSPTCIPARMALMTAMSPWQNGRTGYEEGVEWQPPHTIPGLLREAGYQTVQVGKTHFHPMRAHLGFEINDAYEASIREAGYISDYHRELKRHLPLVEDAALRRHPNAWTVTPWCAQREWHCSEWISDKAIEHIQNRDPQRPLFMQIAYHRPHPPFDPPMDIWQRWQHKEVQDPVVGDWVEDKPEISHAGQLSHERLRASDALAARRGYYASIEHIDEQIGRIYWALRQQGMLHNTYIVLSSDHGEFLGDHHRWHKGQANAAAALIPCIIRPPNNKACERGIQQKRPSLLQELSSSFLSWAGIPKPACSDAKTIEETQDTWIHAEHHSKSEGWHALYSEQWAYHWLCDGTERLFNHELDPNELHECSAEHDNILLEARAVLIKLLHERGCGTSDGQTLKQAHYIGATQERLFN